MLSIGEMDDKLWKNWSAKFGKKTKYYDKMENKVMKVKNVAGAMTNWIQSN